MTKSKRNQISKEIRILKSMLEKQDERRKTKHGEALFQVEHARALSIIGIFVREWRLTVMSDTSPDTVIDHLKTKLEKSPSLDYILERVTASVITDIIRSIGVSPVPVGEAFTDATHAVAA